MEKNRISKYIFGAIILTSLLGLFMFAQCYLGIANDASTGVPDSAPGWKLWHLRLNYLQI